MECFMEQLGKPAYFFWPLSPQLGGIHTVAFMSCLTHIVCSIEKSFVQADGAITTFILCPE